jgi:DNA repair protein RecN (Recombination protein N)
MLRLLYLKDFAIVDELSLELGPGMTVLSGETGAGKSLLVDALLLLSGARGDAAWVRAGSERTDLAAEFSLGADAPAVAKLRALELDDGVECRLRRVVRGDGSSRAYVNDRPVSVATLRDLADGLIEIHGQHEHQALLARGAQLRLLDAFGAHDQAVGAVAQLAQRLRVIERELGTLAGAGGQDPERADWLRFQLQELEREALAPDAWRELEDEHRRLSHAGDLLAGCERIMADLDGETETPALRALAHAENELRRLAEVDPRLGPCLELMAQAGVLAADAVRELARYQTQIELDPGRLTELDASIARQLALARKHRVIPTELWSCAEKLRGELEALANAEQRQHELLRQREALRRAWSDAAATLSRLRQAAALRLARAVQALMGELGMAGGSFEVALESGPGDEYGANGADQCEFLVSANPGQPPRPLRKVASGGELSRIGLAIEVAALGKDAVPTMVFDEVDAGIGGAVAEVVGRKLRTLGEARQVLCVTHLPQVAAQAHAHVAIAKRVAGGATSVAVTTLGEKARHDELARMLGGIEITPKTLAHAGDMLKRARGS